jgi:hypothetical protein
MDIEEQSISENSLYNEQKAVYDQHASRTLKHVSCLGSRWESYEFVVV